VLPTAVLSRNLSTSTASPYRVTVVGAAGGIGQPLSLLMKQNELVKSLAVYDMAPVTPGVAADISHCDTPAKVTGYVGDAQLPEALAGSDMVIVPAGVPRKPGMTRDDLFNTNAKIVASVAAAVAKYCPKAFILVISNPVNSTVPICAEVLKKAGVYNPKRLFGVTTLDIVRANTFVAENQKWDVRKTRVSVVGGHAGITIIPLLSQLKGAKFSDADRDALTQRIMFGGDEVVKAKAGAGSATLSMAYAGAKFADRVLRAANGEKGIVECTYVESKVQAGLDFFSSPVQLGREGIEKVNGLGELSAFEKGLLAKAVPELQDSIKKGVEFAKSFQA
jgi:malate dehydrogenase